MLNSILSRFFYYIASILVAVLFFSASASAAGLIIPANCTVDVSSCTLNVEGDITNAGTLASSTGTISLTGNWLSSGVFTAGTGTVIFNGSGLQTLNTGGLANAFYDLTHNSTGTVQLLTNLVDINHNFSNTAGTFNANNLNMTVGQDWNNDPTATFTPGTSTVTFDGTNQNILGTTTFYNFTKVTASADILYFSANNTDVQTVTHAFTMQGAAGNLLQLNKTGANAQANIKLQSGGTQSFTYLDVRNSNASGGILLIGRTGSLNGGNNTNWIFGNVTLTWDGSDDTDWDNPFNWDLGVVPAAGDTVIVPPTGGGVTFQPTLSSNVTIGNLTIQASAVLTLNGKNLTVSTAFANSGNVKLQGGETLNFSQDTVNPGTFTYVGTNTGATHTIKDFGATDYYHLVIDDQNATKDTFTTSGTMTLAGNLTVSGGTMDNASATAVSIAGNMTISAGTFIAPASTANTALTLAGNFTHSGGTFTHSNGKLTLTGTTQSLAGTTTFYQFRMVPTAASALTFAAGDTFTFVNNLTLGDATATNLLTLSSSSAGSQTKFVLQPGGVQSINHVTVHDNDASTNSGVTLYARSTSNITDNNLNWALAGTFTWTGTTSTDWDTPSNWDIGLVPSSLDTAVVTSAGSQPATLATNVSLAALTVNASSTVDLNGKNMVVSGALTNNGTIKLFGSETTVTFGTMDTAHGIFEYEGNGDGTVDTFTIKDFGTPDYYNLKINDTHATKDIFQAAADLNINGTMTIASGTFTAPAAVTNTAFTVKGDFIHSGGTFNHNNGKLTLDGTNQTISGSTTFYQLRKVVAAADTLTFGAGDTQTVANDITMGGAASQLLAIRSSSSPTQGKISLQAGGTQNISYVDVKDSDASGGVGLVVRTAYINSNNNNNWFFGSATLTWTGTTSTDWAVNTNWDLGLVPIASDSVVISNAGNQPATLSSNMIGLNLVTVDSGGTLSLSGYNFTATGTLTNNGTITRFGNETVTFGTMDTAHGTVIFTGNGDGTSDTFDITDYGANDYYNLVINDPHATKDVFRTNAALTVNGTLTVTGGTFDPSANSNALVVNGIMTVNGGTMTATNATVDANSDVAISSGTFTAPASSTAFTVAGGWSHTGGTFNNSNSKVTFDTTTTSVFAGDTTFYDFASTVPAKIFQFGTGTKQTISHTLTLTGGTGVPIVLQSVTNGNKWSIDVPNGDQLVSSVNVRDSDALNHVITAFNSVDSGNNNSNWVFATLALTAPATGKTIGLTPTLIGTALANTNVTIKDGSNNIVATARSDSNGHFRVVVGEDKDTDGTTSVAVTTLTAGALSLTPYIGAIPGNTNSLTVVASPTTTQVPVIVTPANGSRISGSMPTFTGNGKAAATMTVVSRDLNGDLVMSAGSGTVDASGNYSVTLTTALTKGNNEISVTVDDVASAIFTYSLTDPFGVVYDSTTNKVIKNAQVAIYKSDNSLAVPGTDLDAADKNPAFTDENGAYSFLAANGDYHIGVTAPGYSYPTQLTVLPAGRVFETGSKGETFTVASVILEINHPVDGNGFLLRIEKDANKNEVHVGDVETYTLKIQNLSADNAVNNVLIEDKIPPGFKYLANRVLLDGVPLAEPSGTRPLVFNVGTIPPGGLKTLRYQLVVGAGVVPGTYDNVAVARYANNVIISNRATKSVKVIMDPLFDLGTVIGKIFYDLNGNGVQDAPEYDPTEGTTIIEKPVPNVQIATEDGTVITTDQEGKYSWPGVMPGRHVMRVDERTLPPGTYLTTDKAVIVDVTNGSIAKVNFGINVDENQVVGRDAQFFNDKIALTQVHDRPAPRLNAAMFSPSGLLNQAGPIEELLLYEGTLVRPMEFRIFANYSPFIDSWQLDIVDRDTKKLIRRFEGTRFNMSDPIIWDGRGNDGKLIRFDHKYSYLLTAWDERKVLRDVTREKPLELRVLQTEDELKAEKAKDADQEQIKVRADLYRKWVDTQAAVNNLELQNIRVAGETIKINRQGQDIKTVRIIKDGNLFAEAPVEQFNGLTPQNLMQGAAAAPSDNIEMIVPNGDYTLEVISAGSGESAAPASAVPAVPAFNGAAAPSIAPVLPAPSTALPSILQRYSRPLKVGDDYLMFVGMGDAKVGYTFDRGNIEPVQSNDKYQKGFWKEGKAAYYLKGKIKGKYLITSSFDMDRQQKQLYRQLDPNTYYPVYGDHSSINYDATNTQGPLYLLVEWDKSSAIWGNYVIDFKDTEFAAFTRSYYGGKLDYQSLATNSYGDARTKVVLFHAQIQQRPEHNEFLGTGGSLYFLKHRDIVQGSDHITIQVRDKITGLVLASKDMKNGADYELDEGTGRILFWQPVAMIAKAESIISETLLDGNPVYVVSDYQYIVHDIIKESSEGARVAQGVGDNVVIGGTYIKETQSDKNFALQGTDVTAHLGPDAKVQAEFAQTQSTGTSSYISTDGGITFSELQSGDVTSGVAYGLKGDARLFNRIGLQGYYKWIEGSFTTPSTVSQQGKETAGLALTFDVTPVTRITARQDIQRLINNGNLQTQAQVGATETSTTLIQVVHESERLTLTGAYQLQQVRNRIGDIVTSTNQASKTLAGKADYALNGRVTLTAAQQFDITDKNNNITTVGASAKVTDHLAVRASEAFSPQGTATTLGATQNVTDKIALSSDYTVAQMANGQVNKTTTVGADARLTDKISTGATVAMTDSSNGGKTTTSSLNTTANLDKDTALKASIGKTVSPFGVQKTDTSLGFTSNKSIGFGDKDANLKATAGVQADQTGQLVKTMGIDATQKIDDKTEVTSGVKVDESAQGGKTTLVTFGEKSKINKELEAVSERTFGVNADGTKTDSKYALVRTNAGKKLEAAVTRELADSQSGGISQSNIFGLSGDVNDRLALQATMGKGEVQNLDGSRTHRTAIAIGSGYVYKDPETTMERLKDSSKIEFRFDSGASKTQQYVFYNAFEGRITDNFSINGKIDYSKTVDTGSNMLLERHKEIILGAAYRPVNFDRLNLIAQYNYKDARGPAGQVSTENADVTQTRTQVFSAQAIYDVNENWQLSERFAMRINDEQVTGFEFNRTHTWLMIHRINYKIDRNWTVSGEFRNLTQVEAKDSKQGLLLEATRNINDNAQIGFGWNFTQFNDDLTNLSYTSQGPFLRMTGKLYDRTPEEKARARAKWLDERITQWAWVMVKKELANPKSKVVGDLNRLFAMANTAQKSGQYDLAQQMYKDVIMAGQMMFDEAAEYIRRQINYEEKLQQYNVAAEQYFSNGEYIKARKLWEKIVDDAQKRMVQ